MKVDFSTVLLVDDDPDSINPYIKAIQYKGPAVTTTSNPIEALEFAQRHSFIIILSKVDLPNMSGLDLCTSLKEKLKKKCPVILFDNRDHLDFLENGLKAGADDFFIKDGHPEPAIDCISFWMDSGFLGLPKMSRKKALEYAYLDMGEHTLKGTVKLKSDLLQTLALQVSKEMTAKNPDFGMKLVDRIYFLGRVSHLVLGVCENLVSSIHFPKYLFNVVQCFDFPWIEDVDMLLTYFDSFSENPSFQEGADGGIIGYS